MQHGDAQSVLREEREGLLRPTLPGAFSCSRGGLTHALGPGSPVTLGGWLGWRQGGQRGVHLVNSCRFPERPEDRPEESVNMGISAKESVQGASLPPSSLDRSRARTKLTLILQYK